MPFRIVRNDITKMEVDAIVNAANSSLLGGGGVDGAIHAAAGPLLLEECRTLGGCEPGRAKITKGYNLPAKYVIHTVGPVWDGGGNGEESTLRSCYSESLKLALENGCESVVFPLISSGAYGYPKDKAISVANSVISAFLAGNDMDVYLVVFDSRAFMLGRELRDDINEYISQNYVDEAEEKYGRNRSSRMNFSRASYEVCGSAYEAKKAPLSSRPEKRKPEPVSEECSVCGSVLPEKFELDESFMDTLFRLIDEKGMTDVQCYKRANIDRKYFSKMKKPEYNPTKKVALSFAVALKLDIGETDSLLKKAGFALSDSSLSDVIVRYFIEHKMYDFTEINTCLFEHDQPLLGS